MKSQEIPGNMVAVTIGNSTMLFHRPFRNRFRIPFVSKRK